MLFLVVERLMRVAIPRNHADRYAARRGDVKRLSVNGPFGERQHAQDALSRALASPSCFSARLVTVEELFRLHQIELKKVSGDHRVIEEVLRLYDLHKPE